MIVSSVRDTDVHYVPKLAPCHATAHETAFCVTRIGEPIRRVKAFLVIAAWTFLLFQRAGGTHPADSFTSAWTFMTENTGCMCPGTYDTTFGDGKVDNRLQIRAG